MKEVIISHLIKPITSKGEMVTKNNIRKEVLKSINKNKDHPIPETH